MNLTKHGEGRGGSGKREMGCKRRRRRDGKQGEELGKVEECRGGGGRWREKKGECKGRENGEEEGRKDIRRVGNGKAKEEGRRREG